MRAIAIDRFGGPDVMQLRDDLDAPPAGPDGALVRVCAAGVNPVDAKIRAGALQDMIPHHLPLVPGWDLAGVVERVGPAVIGIAPGDPVLGYARVAHVQHGTYAELAPIPARHLVRIPDGVPVEQAGALPLAGLTAHQSLEAIGIGAGDIVLINVGAGGVGHLAVQLAALRDAHVIAVASAANAQLVSDLGAAEVVDHHEADVADAVREAHPDGIDALFDLRGGDDLAAQVTLLTAHGRVVSIAEPPQVAGGRTGRYVFVTPDGPRLAELAGLLAEGRLRVELQEVLGLERAVEAHRTIEDGHVRGKIVLRI